MKPTFFRTPARLRAWLARNHATATELFIGFYRKHSGKGGITYPQALDEALCFGWIDGRVDRIDDVSWKQRYTPRKPKSYWSKVNIAKAEALLAAGRMAPAGLAAFERRDAGGKERYAFENKPADFPLPYLKAFKANTPAWKWFSASRPSYQRTATFWVMSAKQEATRDRRLATLIACSADGRLAPPFRLPSAADKSGRRKDV